MEVLGDDKDPRNQPKEVQNTSEYEHRCPEQRSQTDPPGTAQNELGDPGDEVDMLAAPGGDGDPRNRLKKLYNASEPERTHSEQAEGGNSPRTASDKPGKPDDEAVIPGNLQRTQGCPRADRNAHGSEMNLPS